MEKEGRVIIYEEGKWTEQTSFVKKITEKVSGIRFMCNTNYTWILQLLHMCGSVEDPEIKNQTLCLLLFGQRQRQLNFGRTILGWSIGKILIIILSLMVSTSRNKNIDNWGKSSSAYEIDHISLLCDSTLSSVLNFCIYLFYCNPKEDHIRKKYK